ARRSARGTAGTACGVAGRFDAELPRGGAFRDPLVEHAAGHELALRNADAFAVERPRPESARTQRIVDDGHSGRKHRLAELVLKEARLARDRRSGNRSRKMAEQGR